MATKSFELSVLAFAALSLSVEAQVAYDNGDLYPGNPDHGWPVSTAALLTTRGRS